jgi:hypothetical protein
VGHEADHSPPSSAEVKNVWSYTSLPQYAFMVWYSVKAQGKLYLYFILANWVYLINTKDLTIQEMFLVLAVFVQISHDNRGLLKDLIYSAPVLVTVLHHHYEM